MALKLLLAVLAVAFLLFAWVGVQAWARRAAGRHPDGGPYREIGGHGNGEAGGCCGCGAAASCASARRDDR